MKKFFVYSATMHGLLFGALFALGTLLARPHMSYYSVDLLTSLPSGTVAPLPETLPAAAEPAAEKEPVPAPVMPKNVPREAIKIAEKHPKRPPPVPQAPKKPVTTRPKAPAMPSWAVANNVDTTHTGPSPLGSNAAAVTAKAGQPFPFPWYLKAVSERLDKAWQAPDEAQEGTSCEVSFVIDRAGGVSNIRVSHASGDPVFDQVAQRAVSNVGSMPPLPSGFPESSLHVHMNFERAKI